MITMLLGREGALHQHCQKVYYSNDTIVIPPALTYQGRVWVRHNANLRSLLAQLRLHMGSSTFETIVMRHKVAASFLLSGAYDLLTSEERNAYRSLSISMMSQTSHNWFTSSFLIDAWAKLFSDLLGASRATLVVPDVEVVNLSFLEVIRRILVGKYIKELNLVAGFNQAERIFYPDSNGIMWDMRIPRNAVKFFLSLEEAVVQEVDSSETLSDYHVYSEKLHMSDDWDDDRDSKLFHLLGTDCACELPSDTLQLLERMFCAFDFRATLQLGLRVLLTHEAYLTPSQKAFVYLMVGVCAHNRQFGSSKGDDNFNRFLEHHFSKALEHESDPIKRSVISYRLTTTLARRKKQAGEALLCVDKALADLRETIAPCRQRAYPEAWLLNIRAYASMLLRNNERSAQDVEAAFNLAEKYWINEDDASPDEIYSAQLFAGNRATLAMYNHDEESLDIWFGKGTNLFEKHWDVGKRYVRFLSIMRARSKFDLQAAAKAGREGLADAVKERSADYQDLYRMNLAEIYFRLGDLENVFLQLRDALVLYEQFRETRRKTTALLLLAAAETRAGRLPSADNLYQEALQLKQHVGELGIPDILSARAILAARLGELREAERLMEEAIRMAVDIGERDLLILVARRAGDLFLSVNDPVQASEAYLRAADVAEATPSGTVHNPPAEEMARVFLGLHTCSREPEYIEKLVSTLPSALSKDSDFWWELPKILHLLHEVKPSGLYPRYRPQLDVLVLAASQREDCSNALREFNYSPSPGTIMPYADPLSKTGTLVYVTTS